MIAIIDYGAGNIKSLQFALTKLELDSCLTTDKQTIENATAIILPGVGAFKDAIEALGELDLIRTIQQEASSGKPLLGICLGMQLFYERSYEDGDWQGLGLIQGDVKRIAESVKVPHMGWNTLSHRQKNPLLSNIKENAYVYFVHSYAVSSYQKEDLVSSADYGGMVPAVVQKENIIGMQFHPEKSGEVGLQLLQNFGEMIS
ncbi:glutamine amidotransferase [Virgibacillus subterraneus]|uniref:Imidazole glycerol phosphate synthase subunit HisH n=2 Tax=Virgibacillus TaxID=84406 RepID=A0A1H1FTU5_9BACI|nr:MULTISPECIES: imidazole glycerol phosphate synthase subunit HisH [Virgibacillus]SDR04503.1 glutamine amidotransferase [Virgibacillus salinus]SEQ75264.1 glutamine amidotransferase [Virgibacillus subterraneus]